MLSTEKRQLITYKIFLETLVKLLFLYNSKKYTENIFGTSFKEYLKYNYIPHKTGRKPKETPLDFINLSRKTPLVFKRDSGRPRISISAKITPISRHQHIKITTGGYYLICKNSEEVQKTQLAKEDSNSYESILKLSNGVLKEVLWPIEKTYEKPKRIRGIKTL